MKQHTRFFFININEEFYLNLNYYDFMLTNRNNIYFNGKPFKLNIENETLANIIPLNSVQ